MLLVPTKQLDLNVPLKKNWILMVFFKWLMN